MSAAQWPSISSRKTNASLALAFRVSLTAHVAGYLIFLLGHHYKLWEKDLWPSWIKKTTQTVLGAKKPQPLAANTTEPQLVFVEVDPNAATPEAPAKPKYYSSQNSKAANPDPKKDTDTPKLEGLQMHVPKTVSVPKPSPAPLQPSPSRESKPQPVAPPPEPEPKPKSGPKPGDLAYAKPDVKLNEGLIVDTKGKTASPTRHQRPTTLAEAQARQPQSGGLAGEMMKQEGGVKRVRLSSSFDAKGTAFGEYDSALIAAVQASWYRLLDERRFPEQVSGMVVVEFNLKFDGTVHQVRTVDSTVGYTLSYLCERAITNPAPYLAWPSDMRKALGNYRYIKFTFYYE